MRLVLATPALVSSATASANWKVSASVAAVAPVRVPAPARTRRTARASLVSVPFVNVARNTSAAVDSASVTTVSATAMFSATVRAAKDK